jgi:hypothetical protein
VCGQLVSVRWLDIRRRTWTGSATLMQMGEDRQLRLITPTEEGYWAVLVQVGG